MTMSAQQQQALDSLYAIDNVLTIKITMPQSDWDAVRTEQPKGGVCNFEWKGGARFAWKTATAVILRCRRKWLCCMRSATWLLKRQVAQL